MDGDGSHADADAVMKATEDNCESDAAWLEQQMLNRTDINKEAGPEEGLRGTLREAGDKDHLLQGETATSFIMSEELKRSTQYPRSETLTRPNTFGPVGDSKIPKGGLCDAASPQPEVGVGIHTELKSPILAPSMPSPTLVGCVAAGIVSGVWGMSREAALSGDMNQTSKFEYKYNPEKLHTSDAATPLSGDYCGYFCLQVPGKIMPIKVVENAMTLEFTPNTAGRLNVCGQGKNRYGPFIISGTCDADGNSLELARAYAPKPLIVPKSKLPKPFPENRLPSGKDLGRVQAALSKPHATSPFTVTPVTALFHRRQANSGSISSVLDNGCGKFEMPMSIYGGDSEGKRSGRARKAPSHLRDGSPSCTGPSGSSSEGLLTNDAFKRCHAIVTSLERSAGADWFSAPVDAVALGVPHYTAIVDAPMDISTVKRCLDHGLYTDPHAFVADIRLVFRNAMTFNVLPEAPVHEAARDIHAKFEDQLKNLWKYLASITLASAKAKAGGFKRDADGDLDITVPKRVKVANVKSGGKKSGKGKKGPRDDDYGALPVGTGMVPVADLVNMQRQMESMQATIAALQKQASQTEVQVQMNMELGVGSAVPVVYAPSKAPRVSKPLTFTEKETLSIDINALPPDKLAHVVKIVQESMPLTSRHDDDEIEVDIETLDNDTLRHLQKYVKASLGKKRATTKKRSQQLAASSPPEITLTSDSRMLESVAFGGSGLDPGFDSDEDDDELAYDVLGA